MFINVVPKLPFILKFQFIKFYQLIHKSNKISTKVILLDVLLALITEGFLIYDSVESVRYYTMHT